MIARTLAYAALALLAPVSLEAQDRFGTYLDWGTVRIILTPSTYHGIHLDLSTTDRALSLSGGGLSAGFDPEQVQLWLAQARAVTRPAAEPASATSVLLTPPLVSMAGDSIRLSRSTRRNRWTPRLRVILDGGGRWGRRFDVLALPGEVEALMTGLQREAGFSGWDPDSIRVATQRRGLELADTAAAVEIDQVPAVLSASPVVYPDRSVQGRVLFEFVVDTAGRVEVATIRPIYSSDIRLIPWGTEMVGRTKFRPGRVRGRPVNVVVRQAVNFTP